MENINLISRERMEDLLCGAIEGGSNYWCCFPDRKEINFYCKNMKDTPLVDKIIKVVFEHNGSIPVYDAEEYTEGDDNTPLGQFNLDNIARGNYLMFTEQPEHFADVLKETDDATTADVWFQLCVMGNIIYG